MFTENDFNIGKAIHDKAIKYGEIRFLWSAPYMSFRKNYYSLNDWSDDKITVHVEMNYGEDTDSVEVTMEELFLTEDEFKAVVFNESYDAALKEYKDHLEYQERNKAKRDKAEFELYQRLAGKFNKMLTEAIINDTQN